jgi:hypothetical protein
MKRMSSSRASLFLINQIPLRRRKSAASMILKQTSSFIDESGGISCRLP